MGYLTRVFRASEEENRRAILRCLPRGRGGALLDVGTHTGEFAARVARHMGARRVVGLELIPEHAAVARRLDMDVIETDVDGGFPVGDGEFDVVHANQIIEHVRRTDVFAREVRRVLRPDGVAVISTNNMSSWHNVVSLVLGMQPAPMHVSDEMILGNPMNPESGVAHPDSGRAHLRLFTGRALADLCAFHGLELIAMRHSGYYPLPPLVARGAVRVDPLHSAFLIGLFRRADGRNYA
jgi:SAM-dependent methyltransferase